MEFTGTSVSFVGNTPPQGSSMNALVQIDGGAQIPITYPPITYMPWYQSPVLSDGKHTIKVSELAGTAVDFAIVEVGPATDVSGMNILVDDTNPSIQYSGSWSRSTENFRPGGLPPGPPVGGSTQRSSTVGDSFQLDFTGTSVSVYGIFQWPSFGSLSLGFTLDGNDPVTQTFTSDAASPQFRNNDGEASNFLFYTLNNISPGKHSLNVTITDCQSQRFIFDYATYRASSASLAPLATVSGPSFTTRTDRPSSSTFTASSSETPIPSLSTSGLPSPSVPAQSGINVDSSGSGIVAPPGVIVGAIVGALAVLFLLLLTFILLRKRRRTRDTRHFAELIDSFPEARMSEARIPFSDNSSQSRTTLPHHIRPTIQITDRKGSVIDRSTPVQTTPVQTTPVHNASTSGEPRSPNNTELPPSYEALNP